MPHRASTGAAVDDAVEVAYVTGPFGVASPTDQVQVQHPAPLRTGGVLVDWTPGLGTVSLVDEDGTKSAFFTFRCEPGGGSGRAARSPVRGSR